MDTVWQAYMDFLRQTETIGLLSVAQVEDFLAEDDDTATTQDDDFLFPIT